MACLQRLGPDPFKHAAHSVRQRTAQRHEQTHAAEALTA
jgi:hypothetical protein